MPNTPEFLILLLSIAFIAPLVLVYLINKNPNLIAKGQDAAGKGMAVGCTSILLLSLAAVLAIGDAITAGVAWDRIGWFWRVLGPLPAAGCVIAFVVIYTNIQLSKARRIERDYQEAMSIPAALIVDMDDYRFLALYNALRPSFETLEISSRQPGALLWQQREWFPRVRVLMMHADSLAQTQGQSGEFACELMSDMCRAKPVCPIILHASTAAAGQAISDRLTKAGWSVQTVVMEGEDWIASRWTRLATNTLKEEMSRRPGPKPETSET
jgi:hypothetical protein